MKFIICLSMILGFGLSLFGQKRPDIKKYQGNYRIIYVSDTLAYANITSRRSIANKNFYDSSLLMTITDSLMTFEKDGYDFTDYKYFNTKKKAISIYKKIYMGELSIAPPLQMQRIYRLNFTSVTNDALVIHFQNIKEMKADETGVTQQISESKYQDEYFGELFLIVVRTANSNSFK